MFVTQLVPSQIYDEMLDELCDPEGSDRLEFWKYAAYTEPNFMCMHDCVHFTGKLS
jgi:hypothetical protein|tara:strand:+ start:3328 stop:3495 length:168 start_codon:yes stop_codon:yes gene_type:complete